MAPPPAAPPAPSAPAAPGAPAVAIGAPRDEGPGDGPAIERLLERCLGPDRRDRASHRFREGGRRPAPGLRLVADAEAGGAPAACLRAYEADAGAPPPGVRLLLLGPLAVEPALRGRGIARGLLAEAIARARRSGAWPGAAVVGDPAWFAPFGFLPASSRGLFLPPALGRGARPVDPARVLALELRPGALDGVSGPILPPPAP